MQRFFCSLGIVALAAIGFAQSPGAQPRFEVASVKPSPPADPGRISAPIGFPDRDGWAEDQDHPGSRVDRGLLAIRDKIAPLVRQGKTVEEVIAAKPTSEYDARVPSAGTTSERFARQVCTELKTPK